LVPVRRATLPSALTAFCFQTNQSYLNYECAANNVHVSARIIKLPGHSEASLASSIPCRMQLRTVLGTSTSTWA